MRPNKIKRLWKEGKPVTMGWLLIATSHTAEAMAGQGFDALCVDMQHGMTDSTQLLPILQTLTLCDVAPVVRMVANDPAAMMRALDMGANTIIVPMINSAQDAARAVEACRYAPAGNRSYGPIRPASYWGADHAQHANDEVLVVGMIETKEGLDNLDAICATPGLDAIYIGPSDLCYALGIPPKSDNTTPIHLEACNRIRDAAHRHGKKVCMHCSSGAFAADAVRRGFDLVMVTSDVGAMVAGAKRQLDELQAKLAA